MDMHACPRGGRETGIGAEREMEPWYPLPSAPGGAKEEILGTL